MAKHEAIMLFQSNDRTVELSVDFDGETVWLSQAQMASLFATTKQNVSLHANNCFKDGELEKGFPKRHCYGGCGCISPLRPSAPKNRKSNGL